MIKQRDVSERQLCVEECDECHVARIIGAACRRPWRKAPAGATCSRGKPACAVQFFDAGVARRKLGLYSQALLKTTCTLRFKEAPRVERKAGLDSGGSLKNRVIIEGSAQDGGSLKLSGVLVAVVVVGGVRGFGGAVLIERLAGS